MKVRKGTEEGLGRSFNSVKKGIVKPSIDSPPLPQPGFTEVTRPGKQVIGSN